MRRPPDFGVSFEELPLDPRERHESLVELFGQYLLWVMRETFSGIQQLLDSKEERNKLGKLFRDTYDAAASLDPSDREIALRLVKGALGLCAQSFLTMISGQGFDDPIGPNHVFRFRLDMEICNAETGEVVSQETINRGGKRFFADYWRRWVSEYGSKKESKSDESLGQHE